MTNSRESLLLLAMIDEFSLEGDLMVPCVALLYVMLNGEMWERAVCACVRSQDLSCLLLQRKYQPTYLSREKLHPSIQVGGNFRIYKQAHSLTHSITRGRKNAKGSHMTYFFLSFLPFHSLYKIRKRAVY